ncbi:MAG: hypothetical protein JWO03_1418, partial [Bacteroidetes bacterium]|nr:hypothetical protein [Bacteroidota bacterium]
MKCVFSHVLTIALFCSLGLVTMETKAAIVPAENEKVYVGANELNEQPLAIDSTATEAKSKDKKEKKQKGEGKSKGQKDSQNQTEFMKADMDAKEYNFYDRKKISTPLMPRYDLDSAVYQKGFKKKEEQQKAFTQNKYHYPA